MCILFVASLAVVHGGTETSRTVMHRHFDITVVYGHCDVATRSGPLELDFDGFLLCYRPFVTTC